VNERFLVTGAHGCIGSWVVHELLADGVPVVALDLSSDASRLNLLVPADELSTVSFVEGDITDAAIVDGAVAEHGITSVIHLAALQVPFCRANPPLGAAVNVVGTVNVFEAVRDRADTARSVVYASSVAAYDALDDSSYKPAMVGQPSTLYGVFKRANEGIAAVYADDFGVRSIGLRPHTVYGVGRDQGLTSAPTHAMLCAAAGVPFRIPFGGSMQLQYARDVARAFIAAAGADEGGASVHDLPGRPVRMKDLVDAIAAAAPDASELISFEPEPLPFPSTLDGSSLEAVAGSLPQTPLGDGVGETVARFRDVLADGRVPAPQ
jgi:nucleoside-diphosphate-sugar epimerase